MDTEIKDLLFKILEGQKSLAAEIGSVNNDINTIKTDVGNIKTDLSNVKTDMNNVKLDVNSVKSEMNSLGDLVRKNSIKLEAIERKIDIVAEVQTSHKEQNENSLNNIESNLKQKLSLIEAATKNISSDVKEVKESIDVLKDMTGRHEVDINILKRRPV